MYYSVHKESNKTVNNLTAVLLSMLFFLSKMQLLHANICRMHTLPATCSLDIMSTSGRKYAMHLSCEFHLQ